MSSNSGRWKKGQSGNPRGRPLKIRRAAPETATLCKKEDRADGFARSVQSGHRTYVLSLELMEIHEFTTGASQKHEQLGVSRGKAAEIRKRLLDQQGGRCGICESVCGHGPNGRGKRSPVVDHCHDTGRIRGALCQSCNSGIGLLGDSPEICRKAAAYLETIRDDAELYPRKGR